MKKLAILAAAGLLAAALVPAGSAVADGPECNLYSHCYGIAHYDSGNITAVGLELWTDCLHLDTPLDDFATHEMWMWTDAVASPNRSWLEAGYIRGYVSGGDTETWFRWFWGEYTGTTLYTHFLEWASVAQWKNLSFYKNYNDTWGVYLNGSYRGTTAQTAANGTYVQVGGESMEPKVYSHGKGRWLQWRQPSDAWVSATPVAFGGTAGVYTGSASGSEMEQSSLQNMCSPAPLAAKKVTGSAPSTTDLKKAALGVAAQYGEKGPKGLKAVATTRKAAQRAIGAGNKLDSDQSVYMVQMEGSFVGRAPKGAPLPRGTAMTVTVDATTGEVTDTSLGNTRQDLAKLGAVKAL